MSFTKIKGEDYTNKGVTGLPDQPALPTLEMQKKFDELSTDVIIPKFNELSEELDEEMEKRSISTIGNDYVDIGVDNCTEVSASVCMTKLSPSVANIVINYKITANTLATDVYKFIDMDKLKTVLGLTYLGFPVGATAVILHPAISYSDGTLTEETAYANADQRGLTGLMMGEGGGLCRIHQIGSTGGAWPLNCAMYKPGTYGTIIINGATIA